MKTKLTFWGSMLFLLSLSILLTIYLAWIFYPLEIQWLNLTDRVYLKPETIQYNFHILMDYLINPFSQDLQMPDFSFVSSWSAPLCGGEESLSPSSDSSSSDTAKFLFLCQRDCEKGLFIFIQ